MNASWIHGCTDKHPVATNMMVVARVKEWIEDVIGEPAVFVLTRDGERNRAAFRIALQDGMAEVEVKAAHALMRHKRSQAWKLDSLMAVMEILS